MILKINTLHFYLVILIYVTNNNFNFCGGEHNVMYLQRPVIAYYNTSFIQNLTITMKRYNRTHPLKFATLTVDVVRSLDNTIRLHLYLHQLLSNVYKRSFVEYHVGMCDGFTNDVIIGTMFTEAFYRVPESNRPMKHPTCPIRPGHYELKDMKLDLINVPSVVPFVEGRVYINATLSGRLIYAVYLDFTIKTLRN